MSVFRVSFYFEVSLFFDKIFSLMVKELILLIEGISLFVLSRIGNYSLNVLDRGSMLLQLLLYRLDIRQILRLYKGVPRLAAS